MGTAVLGGVLCLFLANAGRLMWSMERQWASLGEPWDWSPCDEMEQFYHYCAPAEPTCEVTTVANQATKGLGNALSRFTKDAAEAYEQGCTVNFERDARDKFEIGLHTQQPPPLVPTCVKQGAAEPCSPQGPCVHFSITQPSGIVADALDKARRLVPDEVPVVGIHMRSGWADAMARRADNWMGLECSAYAQREEWSNAEEYIVGFLTESGWHNISYVLDNIAGSADSAFGEGLWKAHIASDSPRVKQYAREYLKSRCKGVMMIEGQIGHNNHKKMDPRMAPELGRTAVADFIALAEVDMLVHFKSKFPRHARDRAMCPQRQLHLQSSDRQADTRQKTLRMDGQIRYLHATPDKQDGAWEAVNSVGIPGDHPCIVEKDLIGCYCLHKFAVGPENDRPVLAQASGTGAHDEL